MIRMQCVGLASVAMNLFVSTGAFGECRDIVMKLHDTSGKGGNDFYEDKPDLYGEERTLTLFLNCHEGSYEFPAATTIHTFEWVNGRICHQWKSCGNVKYWRGHFGVGAVWTWGDSVTDFLSDVRIDNDALVVPGQPGGPGGNVNQNANKSCVNIKNGDSIIFDQNTASSVSLATANQNVKCANIGHLSNRNKQKIINKAVAMGYNPFGYGDYGYHPVCKGGSAFADASSGAVAGNFLNRGRSGATAVGISDADARGGDCYLIGSNHFAPDSANLNFNYQKMNQLCINDSNNAANSTALATVVDAGTNQGDIFFPACQYDRQGNILIGRGGDGGNASSAVIGSRGADIHEEGRAETDWDETSLHVNFALDFGEIERFCRDIAPRDCW